MASFFDSQATGNESFEEPVKDIQLLKIAWVNEKNAPEILPFETLLIQRVSENVKQQQENVSEATGSERFTANLYQMEIDRFQFLLRSYHRTRIFKIEKYALYILRKEELLKRLSDKERSYLEKYVDLVGVHLHSSFLESLPVKLQDLTADEMIPRPNLDTHVFCKALVDVGAFQLEEESSETINMEQDSIFILPYKSIKGLLAEGQVILI